MLLLLLALAGPADLPRLKAQAARVTITRDSWGIAHVHGKTDADAVFGAIYAQAEDDFSRIEANYLTSLGRTAEAADAAPDAIWKDLRQRLYVDPSDLQAKYAASPTWLKRLMDAWADGLNLYLATHPQTHPKVLTHFEPWMALSFTEGSIGGDIEKIDVKALRAVYDPLPLSRKAGEVARHAQRGVTEGAKSTRRRPSELESSPPPPPLRGPPPPLRGRGEEVADLAYREPTGSNGIAIAPKNTKDGHALLLINPHTSFYFRSELQMTSDEGLNAYGASTWGQFFIYQGFNEHAGWMHTTSGADTTDEFSERLLHTYQGPEKYEDGRERPEVIKTPVTLAYRSASGALSSRTFVVSRTRHGPLVRGVEGEIAFSMMYRPVEALSQSWLRIKATDYASFKAVANRYKANSSNNTLIADDKGEIAYLHPQFIPRRDDRFDYRKPVDGADPATAWKGDTPFAQTPHLKNPPSGFLYNSNDQPWLAAGEGSLRKASFPKYMDQAGWNPRSDHALRVLTGKRDFTPESLRAAAYDSWLPEMQKLIPPLLADYDALPAADPLKAKLAQPVQSLRGWDFRWAAASVPTSVGVFYGERLWADLAPSARAQGITTYVAMEERATPAQRLAAFGAAVDKLTADFGRWDTPWGEINRFQRLGRFDRASLRRCQGPRSPCRSRAPSGAPWPASA